MYEGRSGRPFSYIFSGDANGDNRTFNDLFYVPAGPGDVLFGSMNSTTGAFTANAAMEQAFWNWLASVPELNAFRGSYAPANGFRTDWVNTFDLRLSQELPGLFAGHKSKVWVDIQNIGNMLNKDWGHIIDYGFNANTGGPWGSPLLQGIHDRQVRVRLPRYRQWRGRIRPGVGAGLAGQLRHPDQRRVAVVYQDRPEVRVLIQRSIAKPKRPGQPGRFLLRG
ncbi:hypothetical protein [Thermomonas sp.]|uniref:hypothetical protein n=1 Tax=Thermomonas sp. TaxID=1971895 RepID=UPI0025E837FD|nr:hypothetical protein [Thermomonas sp.]